MTSDPMNEAWHEASYYSIRDPQLAFRTGWLAAIERAAERCKAEEERVMGLEKTDPDEGYHYAAEACSILERDIRSLAPEAGDPTAE